MAEDLFNKKRLFIVDGYGMIYRSYYAFISRPLKDPEGLNVSAFFGFFSTLLMVIRDYSPDYLVVAMDSHGPTFRHELYPQYKANRQAAPEDLHAQVPRIIETLDKIGVPVFARPGMEADDLIASLSVIASRRGIDTVMVTADKDLLQLVDDSVFALRPPKGNDKEYRLWKEKEVEEGFGLKSSQIIDYLCILGDSSDNVPGIKGIGDKGAVKLLGEYGTLDNAIAHRSEMTDSMRAKLEAALPTLDLTRRLIALRNDLLDESSFDENAFSASTIDWSKAIADFEKAGSKSLAASASRLVSAKPEARVEPPVIAPALMKTAEGYDRKGDYEAILDCRTLDEKLNQACKSGLIAFDIETDSLDADNANIVGFSFTDRSFHAFYVPIEAGGKSLLDLEEVKAVLSRHLPHVRLIGQNFKYDYKILRHLGVEFGPIAYDTMLAAWLLDSDSGAYNMDDLALKLLGYKTVRYEDVVPKGNSFGTIDLETATGYAAEDSDVTFRLYEVLSRTLEEEGLTKVLNDFELPLIPVLAQMESLGVLLDENRIQQFNDYVNDEIDKVEQQIYEIVGHPFNINSPKQLQEILFVERNLPTGKKTASGFSTDVEVLEDLDGLGTDPVPGLILRQRGLVKLRGYSQALPTLRDKDGRIHTSFMQTGTATGRLSSKSPNLQNIPIRTEEGRRIRDAFVPSQGYAYISADYSQIELVVLAHYAQDKALLSAFREGQDVHRQTASVIFDEMPEFVSPDQRRIAKTINFGVIYGQSPFGLSKTLHITRSDAKHFIDVYFQRYSGVKAFIDKTTEQAEKTQSVQTLFGHKRKLESAASRNKTEKAAGQRMAVNTVIQGTAAEIMKRAMIDVHKAIEHMDAHIILQVHDELILEVRKDLVEEVKAIVKSKMENAVKLSVPTRVSIEDGDSWGKMH